MASHLIFAVYVLEGLSQYVQLQLQPYLCQMCFTVQIFTDFCNQGKVRFCVPWYIKKCLLLKDKYHYDIIHMWNLKYDTNDLICETDSQTQRADLLPRGRRWGRMKWEYGIAAAKSLQSCLTLCDPIDGSPPGSAIPGILQARTLEWVAISFSNACK